MQIECAGVVGLGTMGSGIAEVLARAGLPVSCIEASADLLARGRQRIETSLDRAVARGRLDEEERAAIGSRVSYSLDRTALAEVDLVVEAVPERLEIKSELFASLDALCKPETIFGTNTSSLPVTAIAAGSGRPDRVVGMHFFNPAPVMRLVEVVSTLLTDADAVDAVVDLARRCGKTPVAVGDRAGFIANTLLIGYLGHAARLVDAGVVSVADLDAAMTASCGLPMGPMRLMDLIGLDVTVEILRVLDDEFRSPRYAVAPLLRRLVLAGRLGVKSGRGYYAYDDKAASADVTRGPTAALAEAAIESSIQPGGITVVAAPGGDPEAVAAALGGVATASASGVGRGGSNARIVIAALGDHPDGLLSVAAAVPADVAVVGVHPTRAPRPTPVVELIMPDDPVRSVASAAALDEVRALATAAGRTAVTCRRRPGFAVEALLFSHLDDAARMVGDGYASMADVDAAMTLGCGYPAGPFAMLAEVGAGEVVSGLRARGVEPAPLLVELAAASGS